MSKKKRRVFDIDFDDTAAPVAEPSERRGPMAAAITETAAALNERVDAEAAIRAEQLVAENPEYARGLVFLSRLYLTEGNREQAADTYARALAIDPNSRDDALAHDKTDGLLEQAFAEAEG